LSFSREKRIIFIAICLGIILVGMGVIRNQSSASLYFLCIAAILLWPTREKRSFKLESFSVKKINKEQLQKCERQNSLIESKVKVIDENFVAEDLVSWVKNMFAKYKIAYEKEEWNMLNPFFTESLINQEIKRKSKREENGKKRKFEKINSVQLMSYEANEEKEYLKVKVAFSERIEEYDVKGKIIRGLTKHNTPCTCIILLEREKSIKTERNENSTHCPNCGAPTQILTNGKCKFCGEIIKIEKENWKWAKMNINGNKEVEEKLLELKKQGISKVIRELFSKVQEALNENNMDKLMLVEDGILFERDSQKLQILEQEGKKLVRKDVVIHSVDAYYYEEDNEYEEVSSLIQATLEDYVYVKNTEEVEEGIRDYNVTKTYKLVIKRKVSFEEEANIEKCKNCGATIKINAVGKCAYCDNMIYSNEFNWIVTELDEV